MKSILVTCLLALTYSLSWSQSFEGIIKFNISYDSLPPEMSEAVAMLPKEQTFFIKDAKSKFVQASGMSNTTVISDSDARTSVVLIDAMGQKFKMTIDKDEIEKEEGAVPTIDYVAGTKTIAGYVCKKAVVQMEGFDEQAIFYYTEEIAPLMLNGMEGLHLKGLPLEYIISMNGMKMSMKAASVEKTSVPDSSFEIPVGYTEMPDYMRDAMRQGDN